MTHFIVTVKEIREVDTEFEVIAKDVDTAKHICENYETYYNKLLKLGEDTVTNRSREVTSVTLGYNVHQKD
jgi:hypothetical protein